MFVNMNRSVQSIDIVKANLESFDDFEKAGKHIEFKTVTRNGKTFIQRYNLKNLELAMDKTNTPLNAGLIDKVFHSFYHDGEFIDNEGKVIEISDEVKKHIGGFNFEGHRKDFERKILEGKGKTPEEVESTIKHTDKSRMEEFKKVKEKYEANKEKQQKWLEKNKTRLTNQYNAIYSSENKLSRLKEGLNSINKNSSLLYVNSLFKLTITPIIKNSLDNNRITYKINNKTQQTTLKDFRERIQNKVLTNSNVKNLEPIGLTDVEIEGLNEQSIVQDETNYKTLEQYFKSAIQNAEKEGRIK